MICKTIDLIQIKHDTNLNKTKKWLKVLDGPGAKIFESNRMVVKVRIIPNLDLKNRWDLPLKETEIQEIVIENVK